MRGALFALRILARKYEFKDEEERGPLAPIVAGFLPPLLQILQVGALYGGSGLCLGYVQDPVPSERRRGRA